MERIYLYKEATTSLFNETRTPVTRNETLLLKELLDTNIWCRFEAGDVLLVDRGFRDTLFKISEKEFVPKMPHFSDTPSAPLTTSQSK